MTPSLAFVDIRRYQTGSSGLQYAVTAVFFEFTRYYEGDDKFGRLGVSGFRVRKGHFSVSEWGVF